MFEFFEQKNTSPNLNKKIDPADLDPKNWNKKINLAPLTEIKLGKWEITPKEIKEFNDFWYECNKKILQASYDRFIDPDTSDIERNKLLIFIEKLDKFETNLFVFVKDCLDQKQPQQYLNNQIKQIHKQHNSLLTDLNNTFKKDTFYKEIAMISNILLGVSCILAAVALSPITGGSSFLLILPAIAFLGTAVKMGVQLYDISQETAKEIEGLSGAIQQIKDDAIDAFNRKQIDKKTKNNIEDLANNGREDLRLGFNLPLDEDEDTNPDFNLPL